MSDRNWILVVVGLVIASVFKPYFETIVEVLPWLILLIISIVFLTGIEISLLKIDATLNEDWTLMFSAKTVYLVLAGLGIAIDFLSFTEVDSFGIFLLFQALFIGSMVLELRRSEADSLGPFVLVNIYLLGSIFQNSWWGWSIFICVVGAFTYFAYKFSPSRLDLWSTTLMLLVVALAGIVGTSMPQVTPVSALFLVGIPFAVTQLINVVTWGLRQRLERNYSL